MSTNLWKIPDNSAAIVTPKSLLLQQAAHLSEATSGLLIGEVEGDSDRSRISWRLSVVAPALNDYRVSILEVQHPVHMYPLSVRNDLPSASSYGPPKFEWGECKTQAEFEAVLAEILGSEPVQGVVSALLAQSR